MEFLQILFAVVVVYVVVDIYRRLIDYKRSFRVLLFFNAVVNKALDEKGQISRGEMAEFGKKTLNSKPEGERAQLKKDLAQSGIDLS